jgi:hypothetical protein
MRVLFFMAATVGVIFALQQQQVQAGSVSDVQNSIILTDTKPTK